MSVFELQKSSTMWSFDHENADVTSMRFSNDSSCLAVGTFDGNVYIRQANSGRLMYKIEAVRVTAPITSIKWHPTLANCFICTSSSGYITTYYTENGQNMWTIQEEGNEISTLAISPTGDTFVSAGSDKTVRLYGLQKHILYQELKGKIYEQGKVTGHAQRIYAAVYQDNNTVATAGWDDSVLFWDLRTSEIVRTIYGPHLNGESLAITDKGVLLTGSSRSEDQLQFWDIGKGEIMKSISIGKAAEALFIYSLCVTPDNKFVGVCGGGKKCMQFYRLSDYELVAETESFDSPMNCVHFGSGLFGVGLGNSKVYVDKYAID